MQALAAHAVLSMVVLSPPDARLPCPLHGHSRGAAVRCAAAEPGIVDEFLARLSEIPSPIFNLADDAEGYVRDTLAKLEPMDPSAAEGWFESPHLEAAWQLRYTSSSTYRENKGFSGYAGPAGRLSLATSQLRLQLTRGMSFYSGDAQLVEPLASDSPPVLVEAKWECLADDSLQLTAKRLSVGSRSWKPGSGRASDEVDFDEDKAVRVFTKCYPVYLDERLLVLRGIIPSVVFVFVSDADSDARLGFSETES